MKTEGQATTERFEEPVSEKTWKKSNPQTDPGCEKHIRADKFRKRVRSQREGKEGCINSNNVLLCEEVHEYEILGLSMNRQSSSFTPASREVAFTPTCGGTYMLTTVPRDIGSTSGQSTYEEEPVSESSNIATLEWVATVTCYICLFL